MQLIYLTQGSGARPVCINVEYILCMWPTDSGSTIIKLSGSSDVITVTESISAIRDLIK